MARFAWVTLATNDSYSLGALVLAHSLRRVNTAHDLVVLIAPSVTEAMKTQLSAVYNVVKVVDVLDSKDADNLALLARPELGITFTKLHCWRLTEYDKCVFLDADTLVLQNSDELFDREEFSAAPDAGWPDCFNSGVFVFKPSSDTFKSLIEFALIHGSFDGGDQGLLNLFFSDWATKDIEKHLPFVYNMCSTATYSYLPAFKQFGQKLKIIHFIGAAKPWLQPFNTETSLVQVSGESHHIREFVQFWWDLFCTLVHPSLSSEMAGLAGALATVTLGSPLSAEQCALEEHLRQQGWEQGNIDYMGKDSFANIWKKICDTLSEVSKPIPSPEVPEVPTPAPVAPIAAPMFVSSVEMSPAGPIDTSPPASYAPVSALSLTVVASDTEAVPRAAPAETSTVAPQPQSPSVTEVASAEVTSSAVSSQVTAADSQPVVSSTSTDPATQSVPESVAKTEISIAAVTQTGPLIETTPGQIAIALKQEEFPKVTKTPPTTPVTESVPIVPLPTEVVAAVSPVTGTPVTLPKADISSDASQSTTAIQTSPITEGETPVESKTSEVTPLVLPTKAEGILPVVGEKTVEVPTKLDEISSGLPTAESVLAEAAKPDLSAVVGQTQTSAATAVPTPTPAEASKPENQEGNMNKAQSALVQPVLEPVVKTEVSEGSVAVSDPASLPSTAETLVSPAVPILVTSQPTLAETATPVQLDTCSVTEPAPCTSPPAPVEALAPTETKPAPVQLNTSAVTEPTPSASLPTAEVLTSAPASADAKPTQVQPGTPTVTEPTPPTSPQALPVDPSLTAKLQVEIDVPATPPADTSATQPAEATGTSEEPPVPPKRKGGSKASQEAKNLKGSKPTTKGKK